MPKSNSTQRDQKLLKSISYEELYDTIQTILQPILLNISSKNQIHNSVVKS